LTKLKCAVKISWIAPTKDGGSPIIDYLVEINTASIVDGIKRLKSDKFTEYTKCGKSSDTSECVIPYLALAEKPFNFIHGDIIVARVSSRNLNGFSQASAVSTDKVAFIGLPEPMTAPTFSNE
jgi:hypothetical protein